jgi:hypothetical protein
MKMHISDGELRTYLDQELSNSELERVNAHLASCSTCQERADALSKRAGTIRTRLASLAGSQDIRQISIPTARARLEERIIIKENKSMFDKIFARQYRLAWAVVGLILILGLSLAFPGVRAIANSFLGLFRVQQISVVQVNPENSPEQLGSSSQFEYMLSQDVQVEENGQSQKVEDAAQAAQLAGIPVRLPSDIEGEQHLMVQPGVKATFKIDLPRVKSLLDELGQSDIDLPSSLDGATATMDIPISVSANYGNCDSPSKAIEEGSGDPDSLSTVFSDCISFIQVASPDISAPPGLDIAKIGEAFLQVMGMTPEEAAQFSSTVNWSTTLVVPIPRYGTSYHSVIVDGVEGTLIVKNVEDSPNRYVLLWVKDGIIYALTGPGNGTSALEIANSLK